MSIPQDITIQIFSCLPAKSLMRFKCVSKFYNTIVLEPYFVDIRSSNYSKINRVIGCLDGDFYSIEEDGNATKSYHQLDNFDKLCPHIDRISNCFGYDNGLFCTWDEKYIAIFNPATGEVRYRPYLKCFDDVWYCICSIGFEPEENKYKVLLTIYKQNHLELSRAWVFTLGIDNSWREIITYGKHDYNISDLGYGHCIISGIIYRFSYSPEFCIVAFDIKSEIFTTITMSIEFHNSIDMNIFDKYGDKDYMLIDVNGKLGIMYIPEVFLTKDIHLWILKEEWEHQIFEFPLELKHEDDIYLHPFGICKYGDEEIVFTIWIQSSDDVLAYFYYHVKNKSWRYFKAQEYAWVGSIFAYRESLFPLKNIGLPTTIAE
ncbi:hypothetical protein R3W88_007491 [Solanum pinnatisectum]|uniref:F-box domain-containing protein n=1 Tax=Solanum pinnatisectum TaxID=50273 RepID=A0AAV9M8C0_9SOLN|nr:hypothetical protein R3W88_007491 [Solanum pinnatisectum]